MTSQLRSTNQYRPSSASEWTKVDETVYVIRGLAMMGWDGLFRPDLASTTTRSFRSASAADIH